MEIKPYQPDSSTDSLTQLLRDTYGGSKHFDYFLADVKKAHAFCIGNGNISFHPLAGSEDGKMRAHVALIIDKRLPAGEAFFGFLESPKDASVFNALWSRLVKEALDKGVSVLKGPVNGSIWHQYRCIKESDGSALFTSEPFSEPYYYDFLTSCQPAAEIPYYSAYRDPFDVVLRVIGEDSYDTLAERGFSIRKTGRVASEELLAVATISKTVFCGSWGYTELTEREFADLYSSEKLTAHLNALYVLYKGDEIIGFCGTLKEDERTLICKTICVLPRYQGLGLGNALAHRVHLDAKKSGFERMVYALIRDGNKIQNFPKEGAVVFRRYAAFEFHL